MVGVLILVNEHIAELSLVVLPHRRVALEQMDGMEDQIVKVQGVGRAEALVIGGVDLDDSGHAPVIGGIHTAGKVVDGLSLVLAGADNGEHRAQGELLLL